MARGVAAPQALRRHRRPTRPVTECRTSVPTAQRGRAVHEHRQPHCHSPCARRGWDALAVCGREAGAAQVWGGGRHATACQLHACKRLPRNGVPHPPCRRIATPTPPLALPQLTPTGAAGQRGGQRAAPPAQPGQRRAGGCAAEQPRGSARCGLGRAAGGAGTGHSQVLGAPEQDAAGPVLPVLPALPAHAGHAVAVGHGGALLGAPPHPIRRLLLAGGPALPAAQQPAVPGALGAC